MRPRTNSDRHVTSEVTLTVNGDERDCCVRGCVEIEAGTATVTGTPAVWLGEWRPIDSVGLDSGDRERVEDALCVAAFDAEGDEQ